MVPKKTGALKNDDSISKSLRGFIVGLQVSWKVFRLLQSPIFLHDHHDRVLV